MRRMTHNQLSEKQGKNSVIQPRSQHIWTRSKSQGEVLGTFSNISNKRTGNKGKKGKKSQIKIYVTYKNIFDLLCAINYAKKSLYLRNLYNVFKNISKGLISSKNPKMVDFRSELEKYKHVEFKSDHGLHYTLYVWSRGKQLVLFSRESRETSRLEGKRK